MKVKRVESGFWQLDLGDETRTCPGAQSRRGFDPPAREPPEQRAQANSTNQRAP